MFYDQDYTIAAANLTGFASNVSGAAWTITTAGPGDRLQHLVTIRNDSATDHSAKTIALVGTDANGFAQSETIAAPGASATVTSTKEFRTLTSATPSATIGVDTFDIGWSAVCSSPWVTPFRRSSPVTVGVYLSGTTVNYDVEISLEHPVDTNTRFYDEPNMTAKTAKAYTVLTGPVSAIRVHVNSHTNGTIDIEVVQGE